MSFWQNRSVLVTGASGFVGTSLTKALLDKKSKVITYVKSKVLTPSSFIPNNLIKKIVAQEKGSIEDFKKLDEIIKRYNINTIFHLAAQPIVEIGRINPIITFEVNIRGTWNVLESARQNKVQKVIISSTVQVYGDNPKVPFREEYFPQPSRPYETSKACADLLAQVYANTYNLQVEIPRFVNIYGPADFHFSRLIPKVIKSILKGENPRVWDVGSIRDFLYIDDAVRAYFMLAEKNFHNERRVRVFNFGTDKPISIVNLVKKIIKIAKQDFTNIKIESAPSDRSDEITRQYVSSTKAKKELGWYPKTTLQEGLFRTYKWYKENTGLLL